MIVDQLLARRYFAGRDPIGQRFAFARGDTLTIVGVVASVKQAGLAADDLPEMYGPMAQYDAPTASIAVHTTRDPEVVGVAIRHVVTRLDATVPVSDIRTMNAYMAESIGATRFSTFLASLFALVALILGMIGIYSVLSYIVSQRQREIGIRLALGATHADVISDVARRALTLTGIGIALGSLVAWSVTHLLASLFFGVRPHDPSIFVGAAAVFGIVAVAAASIPAFRTTRVSPTLALTST